MKRQYSIFLLFLNFCYLKNIFFYDANCFFVKKHTQMHYKALMKLTCFFMIDETEYTLKLLGFHDTPTGTPVNEFISQEGDTSQTKLFAKITTPPSEKVPEPTTMVGLGLLGLYIMGRRNQKQKLH
jgi:hypothetical protein